MKRSGIELPRNGNVENVSGAVGRTARSEMKRSGTELPWNGNMENVSGAARRTARRDAFKRGLTPFGEIV